MAKKFKTAASDQPPSADDPRLHLQGYIARYAPEVLLPMAFMADHTPLAFWQQTFQPPQPGEHRQHHQDRVQWPYAERLVYLAREFIKLDNRCRQYVLKAASLKIWWRGDPIDRFRVIVAAHLSYRKLSASEQQAYRQRLMQVALGFRNPQPPASQQQPLGR
jgi:hypothetical protein